MSEHISEILQEADEYHQKSLSFIASENYSSSAVRSAMQSPLNDKYAEGYAGKRYYAGCKYADILENAAIDSLKTLFQCKYANVQPHSGSQANQAVLFSLLDIGDTILSLKLSSGGHLSHGHHRSVIGKAFHIVHYGLDDDNDIDYAQVEMMAREYSPKIIIAGYSAFAFEINWARLYKIAQMHGAYLMADIAHTAGLIAGQAMQSPVGLSDIVTSTTHKTLRGPRGGIIMTNREDIYKKINSGVFPMIQGGPHIPAIAAKAIAFKEANTTAFRAYAKAVVHHAKVMASRFIERGIKVIQPFTKNHIVLLDLSGSTKNGLYVQEKLEEINIFVNKNLIHNDTMSPHITSGIRIGVSACTTRGMQPQHFLRIADIIADIILHDCKCLLEYKSIVQIMSKQHPIDKL